MNRILRPCIATFLQFVEIFIAIVVVSVNDFTSFLAIPFLITIAGIAVGIDYILCKYSYNFGFIFEDIRPIKPVKIHLNY